MRRAQYAPIPVQGSLAPGRTAAQIESTAGKMKPYYERLAERSTIVRNQEKIAKPETMPLEVWRKRETHLLGWLFEAEFHVRRGGKDWCESYLKSARDYYFAMCFDLGVCISGDHRKIFDFAPKMWDFSHGLLEEDEQKPDIFSFNFIAYHIDFYENLYRGRVD